MIGLLWDNGVGEAVLARSSSGALAHDDGLGTAVLLSLFIDRRAEPGARLPDERAFVAFGGRPDRRGSPLDVLAPDDRWGSHLWLLDRESTTTAVLRQAERYARAALQWMIEDGLITALQVAASYGREAWMDLQIDAALPDGSVFSLTVPV
ncbi:phage GP46 family protein [Pararoseomonas sp. SCSIO 73927]|uniref:phage GP46 family protein n=1 Tax=Pararoseomonas sp. SCSIO 73927 TaxID=3114537 RepID=UPI0030D00365